MTISAWDEPGGQWNVLRGNSLFIMVELVLVGMGVSNELNTPSMLQVTIDNDSCGTSGQGSKIPESDIP